MAIGSPAGFDQRPFDYSRTSKFLSAGRTCFFVGTRSPKFQYVSSRKHVTFEETGGKLYPSDAPTQCPRGIRIQQSSRNRASLAAPGRRQQVRRFQRAKLQGKEAPLELGPLHRRPAVSHSSGFTASTVRSISNYRTWNPTGGGLTSMRRSAMHRPRKKSSRRESTKGNDVDPRPERTPAPAGRKPAHRRTFLPARTVRVTRSSGRAISAARRSSRPSSIDCEAANGKVASMTYDDRRFPDAPTR